MLSIVPTPGLAAGMGAVGPAHKCTTGSSRMHPQTVIVVDVAQEDSARYVRQSLDDIVEYS